jgi:hypothetical protein
MRRALTLLAVAIVGAASAASAQGRALTVAQLDQQVNGRFLAHVSNLLEDPEWKERWDNAFFIQLHWKVQLWQKHFLRDTPRAPVEWDVCVQQVPGLDLFNYTEPKGTSRSTVTFRTLDSLRAHLLVPVSLPVPRLSSGSWFYLIDVHVSTSEDDPCDPRTGSAKAGFIQQLVQGTGPTRDLPTVKLEFKVP